MAKTANPEIVQLAKLVKNTRIYLGHSQVDLGKAIGLHRPSISQIESGKRGIGALELREIAGFLRLPIHYFLPDPEGVVSASQFDKPKDLPEEEKRKIVSYAIYLRTATSGRMENRAMNVATEERQRIISEIGIDKALQLEAIVLDEEARKELKDFVDFKISNLTQKG